MASDNADRLRAAGRITGSYLDMSSATDFGTGLRDRTLTCGMTTTAIDALLPDATKDELSIVHDAFAHMILTTSPERDLMSYRVGIRVSQLSLSDTQSRWVELDRQKDADTTALRLANSDLRRASTPTQKATAQAAVDKADIAGDITAGVFTYFFFRAFTAPATLATVEVE